MRKMLLEGKIKLWINIILVWINYHSMKLRAVIIDVMRIKINFSPITYINLGETLLTVIRALSYTKNPEGVLLILLPRE